MRSMLPVAWSVALVSAFHAIPVIAAEPGVEIEVQVKELLMAMRNEDIDWNMNVGGLFPQNGGATVLFAKACGEPTDLLFATLDDPDRFVSAHFLLTCIVLDITPVDGGHWDVLHVVLYGDGSTKIDPAQRTMLKKVWGERLKAWRPKTPPRAPLTRDSWVKVSIKDLAQTINNRDIKWDGNVIGLQPAVEGASRLASNRFRPEMTQRLVSALDDPERFVAAHVLLSKKLLVSRKIQAAEYDHLAVTLQANGAVTIDPAQRGRIKQLWSDRLKGNGDRIRSP
jgi:hypothetical protein